MCFGGRKVKFLQQYCFNAWWTLFLGSKPQGISLQCHMKYIFILDLILLKCFMLQAQLQLLNLEYIKEIFLFVVSFFGQDVLSETGLIKHIYILPETDLRPSLSRFVMDHVLYMWIFTWVKKFAKSQVFRSFTGGNVHES